MKILTFLIIVSSWSLDAFADVQPFNMLIRAGTSYTVPADKTLIIDAAVTVQGGGNSFLRIFMPGVGADEYINYSTAFSLGNNDVQGQGPNNRPHFGPGVKLEVASGAPSIAVIGLISNTADLFASVSAKASAIERTPSDFKADVAVVSNQPVRITAESSDDLRNWTSRPDTTVTKTSAHTYRAVTLDPAKQRDLFRYKATAKPQQ